MASLDEKTLMLLKELEKVIIERMESIILAYPKEIKIERKDFVWNNKIIKEIYSVGIPSFFIMSIGSFLVMGINFILSGISTLAVSLFGIYFKLQTFIYMPTSGVTQGAMPIMGYSYGS